MIFRDIICLLISYFDRRGQSVKLICTSLNKKGTSGSLQFKSCVKLLCRVILWNKTQYTQNTYKNTCKNHRVCRIQSHSNLFCTQSHPTIYSIIYIILVVFINSRIYLYHQRFHSSCHQVWFKFQDWFYEQIRPL